MSLPLRARSVRVVPSQIPTARMPSHFISTQGSPPQRLIAPAASPGVDMVASIGAVPAALPASSRAGRA